MHYLDNSATTSVLPEAIEAAIKMMCVNFGNPSSLHSMGTDALHTLKKSREAVASALSCDASELVFTSGGTESINTALFGAAYKNRHYGRHIITTQIEHAATLNACKRLEQQGFDVTYLCADQSGHISIEDFLQALRQDTILASIMLVNNEIGTVFPVDQIGVVLKRKCPRALYHIDAVQGLFRLPLTPNKWNCDMLSISGHKIGAPKGIGALYINKNVHIPPYLVGGGQESGMRSGTEAIPNIAAFGAACRIRCEHLESDLNHVDQLNKYLWDCLMHEIPWVQKNGAPDIPHVSNFSLCGCKSEVMLRILESEQVFVSSGSACAKGHESHVLKSMGLRKDQIDSALRISFAPFNTLEDVDALIKALKKGVKMLKR